MLARLRSSSTEIFLSLSLSNDQAFIEIELKSLQL